MLTCISLGMRTEKKPSNAAPSPHQHQGAKDVHGDLEEEGVWSQRLGNYLWSPFECPQPWTPFYHTCQQPQHELWVCGGTMSLPWVTEWDRFESLIQELDGKQSDPSPQPTTITDLQLAQYTVRYTFSVNAVRGCIPLFTFRLWFLVSLIHTKPKCNIYSYTTTYTRKQGPATFWRNLVVAWQLLPAKKYSQNMSN